MKRILLLSTALVAVSAGPAMAEPISLAVAALSTASTAAFGGTLISFGLTGLSGLAVDFAVRATLGYALNALGAKATPISSSSESYRNVNSLGSAQPHQVIYGKTRAGGAVFYQALSDSNQSLHRLIAYAGHEIESYEEIYFDDELITLDVDGNVTSPALYAGNAVVKMHLGAPDQVADDLLVTSVSEWTEDHTASNIAYLHVRFDGASNFENGAPTVTAVIKGKKVHDPRSPADPDAWSDNPALCIRDYLLEDYGLAEDEVNINDTLFISAANSCDTLVGTDKTYTCNGSFTLDTSPEDIIRTLLSSMGGIFWNFGGQWAIQPAEYRAPVLSLNEDDLRTGLEVATRHSRADNFNVVRGQYRGGETNYQAVDYDEVRTQLYLDEDGDIVSTSELDLLFTDTNNMAQRIARTFLRRNRKQITVVAGFGLKALDTKIGDNVTLSMEHLGWVDKVFEVVDWRMSLADNDIVINMILRENSETVFTGTLGNLTDESGNDLLGESNETLESILD